jgi:hypothetical protein
MEMIVFVKKFVDGVDQTRSVFWEQSNQENRNVLIL